MKEVEEFRKKLDGLMECSEENLSNCIARQKHKEIEEKVLKKIFK